MKQKVYEIENLCCANCAAKIEEKLNKVPGVMKAVIVFPTHQLRLTAQDPDALLEEVTQIARTVEADVVFKPRSHHDHAHHQHEHEHHRTYHHLSKVDCDCGHDHEPVHKHKDSREQFEKKSKALDLLVGAVLFVAALVLSWLELGRPSELVFLLAYVMLGWDVIRAAVKNCVRGGLLDENVLMTIATVGAFVIGEFPEAVGVMLFYRVGAFFEEKALARSRSQIMDAVDLRPEVVHLIQGSQVKAIPAEDVKVGDRVAVRPGDRIPLDGVVLTGESRIDTAPITGEPVPVRVGPGDELISGCVNGSGQLIMEVRRPLAESMVTRILDSVENAAASKPKIDRFITRFARVYTPIVVGLALAVAVVPALVTGDWHYWV